MEWDTERWFTKTADRTFCRGHYQTVYFIFGIHAIVVVPNLCSLFHFSFLFCLLRRFSGRSWMLNEPIVIVLFYFLSVSLTNMACVIGEFSSQQTANFIKLFSTKWTLKIFGCEMCVNFFLNMCSFIIAENFCSSTRKRRKVNELLGDAKCFAWNCA